MNSLHALDMNLLVAFDTLAQHRHVTKAAEQARITQSAMSHTLKRLRALFSDPLFLRGKDGLLLTPRAEALVVPLRQHLLAITRLLEEPHGFDPSTSRRTFRIVGPDLFESLAVPRLLARFFRHAPFIDLTLLNWPAQLSSRLEAGDIDLAIAPVLLDGGKIGNEDDRGDLQRKTVARDTFCCWVRKGHPLLKKQRSLQAFVEADHALVSPAGEGSGIVDRALALRGHERRIRARLPQFSSAIHVVEQTSLVLTAPSALRHVVTDRVVSFPAPLKLPAYAITLLWHRRYTDDPAHRWLRDEVTKVMGIFNDAQ